MGKLEVMINNNEIDLSQFMTMHPFSATENLIYNCALEDVNFFETLYIKNHKTYERLSTICNVIDNTAKNLIVITGYRGCGKTNFLHLIEHIFKDNTLNESIREVYEKELNCALNIESLRTVVKNNYENSLKRIQTNFFLVPSFYNADENTINEKLNSYIKTHLTGKCKYINFDEGGMGREKPFSTKLFYILRASISVHKKDSNFNKIVDLIDGFVTRNKWTIEENFVNIDYKELKLFWKNIHNILNDINNDEFYECLFDELKKLELEQLLFVYTIWEYAEIIVTVPDNADKKLLCLLDNIDMISDGKTNIFQNTIMGIWRYIWDSRNVFNKIKQTTCAEDLKFINLYNNTKIIVAMRETTAMHISGHLRDKMRGLMEHFDMSSDIDKTMIMQRKIDYGMSMICNGEIVNNNFILAMQCLNQLISDRILMRNIFLLYNNDYRTSMLSLITICIENFNVVKLAVDLIKSDNSSKVFGGRGIIYRLILDAFFEWLYFDAIGITSPKSSNRFISLQSPYGYSCARILLTILCNKQSKNTERFFVNPEESVKLADLYSMVKDIMTLDDFINIIDGMYSLRNKKYWNHLITFDNIWSYSPDVIKKYINKEPHTEQSDIYVRATTAGQFFAGTLCTHFEYFASRFCNDYKNKSLFSICNITEHQQLIAMKAIINDVYNSVEKCQHTLESYNRTVLSTLNKVHYSEVLGTPYYYEKQFHEERIIHSHISYLEAYRNFIMQSSDDKNALNEANCFIIETIKKYLELLKYKPNESLRNYRDLFISPNSKNLYNELSVCIEKMDYKSDINKNIEITRQYYKAHFSGEECSFLKELNRI